MKSWKKIAIIGGLLGVLGAPAAVLWNQYHARVGLEFDPRGLESIRYQGMDYLAKGEFQVRRVVMEDPAGKQFDAELRPAVKVDPGDQTVTQTFAWGVVRTSYTVQGNRVDVRIQTINRSGQTIAALHFEPMVLRFPEKPKEYDGSVPMLGHNIGTPTIVPLTFGRSRVVISNEDVKRPLIMGLPWSTDKPYSTTFPLRIDTGSEKMYPDSLPVITRPIASGHQDEYHIALRFGDSTAGDAELTADLCRRFAAAHPSRLNWKDHRPIGTLSLASTARVLPTNPRGWFNDAAIDVTTTEGVSKFKNRVLSFADAAISILTDMDAQGMITWDIEGEQYPHAVYTGDPRLVTSFAPEMETVVDQYFQRFRDAGFRVGVCVRPQEVVRSADGKSATQRETSNPVGVLRDKIAYARKRWGASLFYIGYNGEPSRPLSADVIARLATEFPDVLLIPEHKNVEYYAYSAPYTNLQQGTAITSTLIRSVYPSAFSVINTADGPIDMLHNELVAGVKSGDILLYRTWYPDPANARIKNIYQLKENMSRAFGFDALTGAAALVLRSGQQR